MWIYHVQYWIFFGFQNDLADFGKTVIKGWAKPESKTEKLQKNLKTESEHKTDGFILNLKKPANFGAIHVLIRITTP